MLGILMFAAAANAPTILDARDEVQWRMFVRTSLQRQAAPRGARLRQLEGVVRRLGDEERDVGMAGPSGL